LTGPYFLLSDTQNRGKHCSEINKLLVYITGSLEIDILALCKLGYHEKLYASASRVVMITHHAGLIAESSSFCHAPKCSLVTLGDHVLQSAKSISNDLLIDKNVPIDLRYFYPVLELPPSTFLHLL
jgi:hypothetical protein